MLLLPQKILIWILLIIDEAFITIAFFTRSYTLRKKKNNWEAETVSLKVDAYILFRAS